MSHIAKATEYLWVYSMGKRFRVLGIFDTDNEANAYCKSHDEGAVIACFGPFVIVANKYAAIVEPTRRAGVLLDDLERLTGGK